VTRQWITGPLLPTHIIQSHQHLSLRRIVFGSLALFDISHRATPELHLFICKSRFFLPSLCSAVSLPLLSFFTRCVSLPVRTYVDTRCTQVYAGSRNSISPLSHFHYFAFHLSSHSLLTLTLSLSLSLFFSSFTLCIEGCCSIHFTHSTKSRSLYCCCENLLSVPSPQTVRLFLKMLFRVTFRTLPITCSSLYKLGLALIGGGYFVNNDKFHYVYVMRLFEKFFA
jgi:hypothetical protein